MAAEPVGYRYRLDCPSGYSLSLALDRALRRRQHWHPVKSPAARFHLLLGDRWSINYSQLTGKAEYGVTQMVNYFKGSHRLTLKGAMVRSLRASMGAEAAYGLTPVSFVLKPRPPPDAVLAEDDGAPSCESAQPSPPSSALGRFISAQRSAERKRPAEEVHACERDDFLAYASSHAPAIWIAKPSAGSKGAGILLSRSCEGVLDHVDRCQRAKEVFVVQRYIERPLLVGRRKFDIRCWVLLTAPYDIHLFNQASLRTASEAYDVQRLDRTLSHLTNHCLQMEAEDFGRWEPGNEMWWAQLQAHIADQGRSVEADILPQVRAICQASLLSVYDQLRLQGDYNAFQLFGFDLMVDADFKVWLLEINGSPAAAARLYESIAEGIIRLCLDTHFPPPPDDPPSALPEVDGLGIPQFELVYRHPAP
eukprot:GGOE01020317.1.p1 GENE.GGOE01020317.1~~GGOE01020317.1.p1  ORF type:complete len:437 (+),score=105.42 GGOE01020317.1:49-1311(+)